MARGDARTTAEAMMDDQNSPDWVERRSIIPLRAGRAGAGGAGQRQSGEKITGLHRDTIKRRYPHLIKKISLRREGIALGDALAIASGEAAPAAAA
jgi:hypothetical protein